MHAAKPYLLPSIKTLLVEISHDRISHHPERPYLNSDAPPFTHSKIRPLDVLLSPGDQLPSYQLADKQSKNMFPRLPSLASTIGSIAKHPGSSNIHSLLSPPESPDTIKPETSFDEHESRQQHSEKNHHHEYNSYVKVPSTTTIHPSLPTPSIIYPNPPYPTHLRQEERGCSLNRDCDRYSTSCNILQPTFTSFEHVPRSHLEISQGTSGHEQRFSRPSSLRIHTYSHTGEKPFVCTEPGCGRKFSVQSNMRRHLRVHRLGRTVKKPRYDGEVEGVKMMNPGIHMRN
ncbi:13656_t:CDS:2 [Acaulospora morrowiae]|uniref:13656_t:CDS:1 n=1 Tax=Acaulospora morrowiae TaxID=94023 RepID=A0A9N8ZDS0_9GLOM|nr:13656_t:CDS:2 [Acaulospora morrowiae]